MLARLSTLLVPVAAVAACCVLLVPSRRVVAVRSHPSGELRYCAPMSEGEEFVIAYVHSVNRRPVEDTLRVEGRGLRIVHSRFDAFGAGIPETGTPEHPLRTLPDGRLEYVVDRPVEEVTVRVGRVAEHTLKLKGRSLRLDRLQPPGRALRLTVERQSLFEIVRAERRHG